MPDESRYSRYKLALVSRAFLVCFLRAPTWAGPKRHLPPEPAENPTTKAKAELGKLLVFEQGGYPNPWLSPALKPLGLTAGEKEDPLAFLRALEGDKVLVAAPTAFPR